MGTEVKFKFVKATPGTYKFEEIEVPHQALVIGSLYVKKWWFDSQPEFVTVTLEAK